MQAQQWIESVIGERFPQAPYEYALRDGIILCKLMNRLAPGIIQKINVTGGDYKMMDNVNQLVSISFFAYFSFIYQHFTWKPKLPFDQGQSKRLRRPGENYFFHPINLN